MGGDRGRGDLRDFPILDDGAARHADCANHGSLRIEQRDAAGEGGETAIAAFEAGSGCASTPHVRFERNP